MSGGEEISVDPSYLAQLSATLLRSGNVPAIFSNLATATGGFALTGTNDLSSRLQRLDEDRRLYYLLSYVPAKAVVEGEYRRVTFTEAAGTRTTTGTTVEPSTIGNWNALAVSVRSRGGGAASSAFSAGTSNGSTAPDVGLRDET
jgi:hypothetical protein